jgi:hypothetical protein
MALVDLVRFGDDARSNKDLLLDVASLGTDQKATVTIAIPEKSCCW